IKFIDEQKSFAAQLGQKKGGDTPVMSKLRFSHLLAVKTPDELLRQLRRAVKLLDGSVNLFSLADDIKFIDEQKSFAAQLGQKKGGDTPVMSKLRFSH
ncbi:type I-E CRISPR-associated protein Cse2/CasB, partial [Salmonella enterica subsp. enterica]